MYRRFKLIIAAALISLLSVSVNLSAAEKQKKTHLLMGIGADYGGDTLVVVDMVDGPDNPIQAHEAYSLYTAWNLEIAHWLDVRAGAGYRFNSVTSSNGSARLTSIPIEILLLLHKGGLRFGGGLGYQAMPQYTCDIAGLCATEMKFNASPYSVIYADYSFGSMPRKRQYFLSVRYDYGMLENAAGKTFQANGMGVGFGIRFR